MQFHQVEIGVGEEGAQHHQVTLGKVHHLGGLVNQHKTKGDQAIDTSLGNTAHQELKNFQNLTLF